MHHLWLLRLFPWRLLLFHLDQHLSDLGVLCAALLLEAWDLRFEFLRVLFSLSEVLELKLLEALHSSHGLPQQI